MSSDTSSQPNKILVRTPNWLGDLMMSTAFVDALLNQFPDATVDLIVKRGFEELPLPCRGTILGFDKRKDNFFEFAKKLKSHDYDRAYVLPPSFSSALMIFLAKIPERYGLRNPFRNFLLNPSVKLDQKSRTNHLVREYLTLLKNGETPKDYLPSLKIRPPWAHQQLKNLESTLPKDYIVFTPGAIYGPAKQWPVEYFSELAKLLKHDGQQILVLGTKDDYPKGEAIKEGLDYVVNLCGMTSLCELVAILSKSRLLVSNDSGAMHITAAMQRPQIAIFGSTSNVWTIPLNPKAITLHLGLKCSPCYKRVCRYGHYDCLKKITPQDVYKQITLLNINEA
ncbi:MAG: lipopolysaccharide heptosyltransferase II [Deltaproteobacteria bacterium]|nr:lipopolysaccharide heptosyltransferase II [Deltaproteobacteria bacterium]